MDCPYFRKGISIKPTGEMLPCCLYTSNTNLNINTTTVKEYFQSPILDELETSMKNNIWPTGCSRCKQDEENGQVSMRMSAVALKSKLFEKYYIEMNIGSECNSDCVMCVPSSSSKIQSRIKHHGTIPEIPYNFTALKSNWVKNKEVWEDFESNIESIGCVKFLGGEPFMIKNIWKWIEQDLVQKQKQNIVLQITTNSSILPDDKINLLNGWKELIINVSIDATEKQFEWIRQGLEWDTVSNNAKKLIALENSTVSIQFAASIYSITGIVKLIDWINEIGCLFAFLPVVKPLYLSLQYAPVEILQSILLELNKKKMKKPQNQIHLNSLKKFIQKSIDNNKYDPVILKKVTDYFNNHRLNKMNIVTLELENNNTY